MSRRRLLEVILTAIIGGLAGFGIFTVDQGDALSECQDQLSVAFPAEEELDASLEEFTEEAEDEAIEEFIEADE